MKITRENNDQVKIKYIKDFDNLQAVSLQGGLCTLYDTKREMLWIPSTNDDATNPEIYYYYIEAKNGDISKKINFDYWPLDQGCDYDETLDKIIGISWIGWNGINKTFTLDFEITGPKSLTIESNFSVLDNWCGSSGVLTYDNDNGIYYAILYDNDKNNCGNLNFTDINGELIGINITNSNIVSKMTVCKDVSTKHIVYSNYPNDIQYWKGTKEIIKSNYNS